jgi:hypothetical protein
MKSSSQLLFFLAKSLPPAPSPCGGMVMSKGNEWSFFLLLKMNHFVARHVLANIKNYTQKP